jgi:peptide-methionine (S)-S-oxide reductase
VGKVFAWMGGTVLAAGVVLAVLVSGGVLPLPGKGADPERVERLKKPADETPPAESAVATFGNGCFWCTEAVFQQLKGVHSVEPGYTGGSVKDPTYEQVCSGTTGHAEALRITYDPKVITYAELLEVFWKTHDPTTLDRQGADVGTQYRSAIFYHSKQQKEQAEHYKRELDDSGAFKRPIVTQIVPAGTFYPAEEKHKDFYLRHPTQGYCQMVIAPKLEKFEKAFKKKLKPAAEP